MRSIRASQLPFELGGTSVEVNGRRANLLSSLRVKQLHHSAQTEADRPMSWYAR